MIAWGDFSLLDPEGLMAVTGLILGVLGIAVGVMYARRRAQLVFTQTGNVVVDATKPEANDIEIAWQGTKVPSVSRARIAIWNDGAITLEGAAVVPNYPLRLSFKGEVLAVSVLARSNVENAFDAWTDPEVKNAVRISFDYLDHRHGALIEVIHSSSRWGGSPSGTVKGTSQALCERVAWEEGDSSLAISLVLLSVFLSISVVTTSSIAGKTITGLALGIPMIFFLLLVASKWRGRPPKALRVSDKPELPAWRRFLKSLP